MSEDMKLFFLWPRLLHDISRRVRYQGPTSFHTAVQIAQRIEASANPDAPITLVPQPITHRHPVESNPINPMPMDIEIQNSQVTSHRALPPRDAQGRPKCFYCNTYGHVRQHCRQLQA
ncbi:hypothetical protein GOP47_0012824 [Adiantum capillus-veneris]|uniref:CCHC-type domain-containing protein n=1 Tax=Adiantum capillus-veneris TaxID=13818 RepID=A0A9D4URF1_ADICA|nr:hypothetical protein GOP47_0012824 [Adiantum capillus-veneris]